MKIEKNTKPKDGLKMKRNALLSGLVLVNVLFASGCSSMSERSSVDFLKAIQPEEATAEPREQLYTSSGLTAGMMTQILAAELLVEKGQPAKAYELLFPLAEQTRDVGLVERTFQLSMATYQEPEIFKTTQLWLEVDPANPVPWRAAYLMSLRQGDLNLAIEQWNQYQKISDLERTEDVLSTAQRVVRSAKAEVAMPFYEVVVSQNPTLWQSYYGLGVLATHYGLAEESVESLQKALSLLKTSEATLDMKRNAEKQIYQLLSQSYLQMDNPNEGLSVLSAYLVEKPDDWLVQERLARLEVKANELSSAEKRYETILKANPGAATSRLSLALLQIEREKFVDAKTNLLQVTETQAYESVGFYYLGVLGQEQNQVEEAIGFFNRVEAMPYAVDAKLHIAEMLYPDQGLEAALGVLDSIKTSDVEAEVKILRAKAIFYRVSGQNEQAAKRYEDALKLAPKSEEMLLSQAALFYELQAYEDYVESLEKLLSINPDSVKALNALGYYYVEQGHSFDKASLLLERALALAPESYYVLDSVGWLAYQQNDFVSAKKYLTKALALEHDEEVVIHLVATHWQLGQKEKAKQLWQKHLPEFSKNKRYQKLIENLQSGVAIK
ncbi:MAG: tetratricopeptide repeat protein [Thiotrichales bacterium]|nr:tetratricopeptide repeat protein [Thiotrichales bacterium]